MKFYRVLDKKDDEFLLIIVLHLFEEIKPCNYPLTVELMATFTTDVSIKNSPTTT